MKKVICRDKVVEAIIQVAKKRAALREGDYVV